MNHVASDSNPSLCPSREACAREFREALEKRSDRWDERFDALELHFGRLEGRVDSVLKTILDRGTAADSNPPPGQMNLEVGKARVRGSGLLVAVIAVLVATILAAAWVAGQAVGTHSKTQAIVAT